MAENDNSTPPIQEVKTGRTPERIARYNANRRAKRAADPSVAEAERERKRAKELANPGKAAAEKRAWRLANPGKDAETCRRWREKNREKHRACSKRWAARNPERVAENVRAWRAANLSDWKQEHYASDADYRIACSLREKLRKALRSIGKRKSRHTLDLIGCAKAELRAHIEAQFTDRMSWENYGLWHIDHIRPVCTFDLTDTEQQKIAFHFTNLRPLWAADNLARRRRTWTAEAA